jgi:hypothetical protein
LMTVLTSGVKLEFITIMRAMAFWEVKSVPSNLSDCQRGCEKEGKTDGDLFAHHSRFFWHSPQLEKKTSNSITDGVVSRICGDSPLSHNGTTQ